MKKTHPWMHSRFKELTREDKILAKKLVEKMLEEDNFFITMLAERGRKDTLVSATATATNRILRGNFHEKFGDRPTSFR